MTDADLSTPTYSPVDDNGYLHVRRFNFEVTHLLPAEDAASSLVVAKWVGPPYWALLSSWVALCGVVLHPDQRGMVAMKVERDVSCRACRRVRSRAPRADA